MEKFDFQNMDIKLFMALKELHASAMHMVPHQVSEKAESALAEFETSLGPLPEWAIARNWDYSLVVGAQLLTRDGRQHGNAHIIHIDDAGNHGDVFYLLTDAGNPLQRSEPELLASFYIGDFISKVDYVLDSFDRNNHYPEFRQ